MTEPVLTRRAFVKAGGALVVALNLPQPFGSGEAEVSARALDATKLASWLEIRADGSVVARTGRTETGTSVSAFYAQVIAEELNVQPSVITVILGSTDDTPDGGYSAGFLGGANNQRKVAAYAFQALLGLASTRLGVPVGSLTVKEGIVSGGGNSVSYAELVAGQHLSLEIPVSGHLPRVDPARAVGVADLAGLTVTGTPPAKPIAHYTVVGTSHERPGVRDIVTGKAQYAGDVSLPGMMHARMIRPPTLGARLISAGRADASRFPTAEVMTRGDLVAVVSPDEWEAVQAGRVVAAQTRWTPWAGLPASDSVISHLRAQSWTSVGTRGDAARAEAGLRAAAKVVSATYEQPYVRHAPIGAFVALADVRADGTVTIWAQSSNPQGARAQVAHLLGVPVDKVVVRWVQGPGQYGRTTNSGDGAIADAAILSQMLGKPVRVQWTLADDLMWSSVSPAWVADVKVGLDANGDVLAYHSDWYSPHENDVRMAGALLAGMPTVSPKVTNDVLRVSTVWAYDKVPGVFEQAHHVPNIADAAHGGLRGNIMRTPWQRQQNFALEGIMTEAAAAAGADPIAFRIRHTTNAALIGILNATAEAAGWQPRRSPHPGARRAGKAPVTGRGVGVVIRAGAPWVCIAEVEVVPTTGVVRATRLTMGVDVGKVINPRHLKSMLEGGAVMGLSEALLEEVTFDTGRVTSTDWKQYRIARMADVPEIKTVFTSRDDRGINGGGEAANAVSPVAIAAAFFDATGVMPRRVPLTPAYVQRLLTA